MTLFAGWHASLAALPARGSGWIGDWSPGIGDPSLGGWLTVLLYFVAAWRCWVARKGRTTARPRERALWKYLALLLLALGINKQLDLQSAVTEFGRLLAYDEGWYSTRAEVQRAFVAFVGLLALIGSAALLFALRGASRSAKVAALGFAMLALFVCVRAASFHHVDRFIVSEWFGLRANWLLEVGGILVVLFAAGWRGSGALPRVAPAPPAPQKVRVVVVEERSNEKGRRRSR